MNKTCKGCYAAVRICHPSHRSQRWDARVVHMKKPETTQHIHVVIAVDAIRISTRQKGTVRNDKSIWLFR